MKIVCTTLLLIDVIDVIDVKPSFNFKKLK